MPMSVPILMPTPLRTSRLVLVNTHVGHTNLDQLKRDYVTTDNIPDWMRGTRYIKTRGIDIWNIT